MSTIKLEAELRSDMGKGSSRRLRRLENKVPAIIYGGEKPVKPIHISHHKVIKALEIESIYSSVFDVVIDGKAEHVILKDLQRHPYKPIILHMDFQRVSAKDVLVKMIPLHFINEEQSEGVKAGGLVTHTMTQVEIKCQVKDLPEFIAVDLGQMKVDDVLHLSDIQLPKGVKLSINPAEGDHDHPVVSIHLPRTSAADMIAEAEEKAEAEAESQEAAVEKIEEISEPSSAPESSEE